MNHVILSDKNLKSLARVHAHLCGDGGLYAYKTSEKDRKNRAEIYYFNSNPELIKSFQQDMNKLFHVQMTYLPKYQRIKVSSIKIANILLKLSEYGTRKWRIPRLIKKADRYIKLEWLKAFCHDEGYTPKSRKIIRIKSMNLSGLKDAKALLDSIRIESWITQNKCDNSWYLSIRKMRELEYFIKKPSRKKIK